MICTYVFPFWQPLCPFWQVVFNDSSGSADVSAVQLDDQSSYKAEDTSFVGFTGEVPRFLIVFRREAGLAKRFMPCLPWGAKSLPSVPEEHFMIPIPHTSCQGNELPWSGHQSNCKR